MTGWIGDVRHALRSLERSPESVAAALAILALGIGVDPVEVLRSE